MLPGRKKRGVQAAWNTAFQGDISASIVVPGDLSNHAQINFSVGNLSTPALGTYDQHSIPDSYVTSGRLLSSGMDPSE